MRINRYFLMGLMACLSACTLLPASKTNHTNSTASQALYQQHLATLAMVSAFSLEGRIGVQADGKGFSGRIDWQHHTDKDDIALYSPLGGQVATIKKTVGNVTLIDANRREISASDAETLTQKALGWSLPLTGLSDWALGRPAAHDIQSMSLDEQGHLRTLNQDGWSIEYQQYAQVQGRLLPSKIVFRRDKVYLKLLIEKWREIDAALDSADLNQ